MRLAGISYFGLVCLNLFGAALALLANNMFVLVWCSCCGCYFLNKFLNVMDDELEKKDE